MTKTIKELMTKDVISVSPGQSIQEAAKLMSQYNVGALPVVENNQLKGIITDRDITLRSTAKGGTGNETVSDCMSSHSLVSGTPDMSADEATQVMAQHQIRRLPIVDQNQLVGMVALGDLATTYESQSEAGEALQSISTPSEPQ
ncbi:CBS domain-containing protein [Pullulanibacillus sp. KACC 23026]|uniref:CBS domain-containing protein n=1 Tax=Pullulanibacillus sp. KACC 23026 TaxID=3028315 RepID=UPI0023AF3FDB|nr:CBS domain-containing protein [Pullulanibacillus sp. KACC 23026]WEG12153.1 CBS domain-containing protein [Pullulanibacillus sp. KACC 23026]